ncbi:GNAT family N-acetyltransferase [Caryophanon tenue]|uniref:Acetyltransferase n=1 Tax=Caryophanon tenue TaxID=33978 RepID=A0A1C0YD04_9BACL|nr:GNAT family N-acetyltransferase [Caryophanon tenue]OCS85058.1 acetyltransferase [Caryophanon tenue]
MNYITTADTVTATMLTGFFVDWPNPPQPKTHVTLLQNSDYVVLAVNEEQQVVGFITAISDGVLSAYIPLLEVLPNYQHQGIGQQLVTRMFKQLEHLYMIDICCDAELRPYYEKLGMTSTVGMVKRNYRHQSGHLKHH